MRATEGSNLTEARSITTSSGYETQDFRDGPGVSWVGFETKSAGLWNESSYD